MPKLSTKHTFVRFTKNGKGALFRKCPKRANSKTQSLTPPSLQRVEAPGEPVTFAALQPHQRERCGRRGRARLRTPAQVRRRPAPPPRHARHGIYPITRWQPLARHLSRKYMWPVPRGSVCVFIKAPSRARILLPAPPTPALSTGLHRRRDRVLRDHGDAAVVNGVPERPEAGHGRPGHQLHAPRARLPELDGALPRRHGDVPERRGEGAAVRHAARRGRAARQEDDASAR